MTLFKKGNTPWNKGQNLSKQQRETKGAIPVAPWPWHVYPQKELLERYEGVGMLQYRRATYSRRFYFKKLASADEVHGIPTMEKGLLYQL